MAIERSVEAEEKEVKAAVTWYFKSQFDNTFGYITEKLEKLDSFQYGEGWKAFMMIHPLVRKRLFSGLSKRSKEYLVDRKMMNADGSLIMS